MIKYYKILFKYRHILLSLVRQDIKVRYQRSILGILWSFISPLGLALIVAFVYSKIFNANFKSFFPYFFSGLISWNFIAGSANAGTSAFLSAEGYIKQINVPLEIFPLRTTLVTGFHFIMAVLAFFMLGLFSYPTIFSFNSLIFLPCVVLLTWICSFIAVITAFLNTYFRDYMHLQTIVLQAFFYVTPIIYQPHMLDAREASYIYKLNPFYYLINMVRQPLLGKPVPLAPLLYGILIGLLLNILTLLLLKYNKHQVVFKF
jgi:ABC-type polysaccharide/polyol phosphate export permease